MNREIQIRWSKQGRGGAHRKDVAGEVSAVMEVDVDGDLGVLVDGGVADDLQLEVEGALAKRRPRTRPAEVARGDWKLGRGYAA
jgi:hypothetical protein